MSRSVGSLAVMLGLILLLSCTARTAPTRWTLRWAYPFPQVTATSFEVYTCAVTNATCTTQLLTTVPGTTHDLQVQVPDPPQIQCYKVRALTATAPSPFTALVCAIKEQVKAQIQERKGT